MTNIKLIKLSVYFVTNLMNIYAMIHVWVNVYMKATFICLYFTMCFSYYILWSLSVCSFHRLHISTVIKAIITERFLSRWFILKILREPHPVELVIVKTFPRWRRRHLRRLCPWRLRLQWPRQGNQSTWNCHPANWIKMDRDLQSTIILQESKEITRKSN